MALSGKYVSFKQIIEQVLSKNAYSFEIPVTDTIEWMADCLNLIGHPDQYEPKIAGYKEYTPFDVTKYRAQLPCDFYQVVQVAVDGVLAIPSDNSFHYLLDGKCCGVDVAEEALGDTFVDNFGNNFNTALGTKYSSEPVTYSMNNDYITLSEKTGKICMAYRALMTDDEGFIMIPDDVSYKLAVTWYVTHRLDFIGWRNGEVSDKVFAYTEKQYEWYVGQASNRAKMPDLPRMAAIKDQMLRLLPKINHEKNFFQGLSAAESRKIT